MNVKKLFGTIAGLAVLAGLSWHQVRHDEPGVGMEDLMTGTAMKKPVAEEPAPDISSSPEVAAEQECEPAEENGCDSSNTNSPDNQLPGNQSG